MWDLVNLEQSGFGYWFSESKNTFIAFSIVDLVGKVGLVWVLGEFLVGFFWSVTVFVSDRFGGLGGNI
jgi:hypothetical protein